MTAASTVETPATMVRLLSTTRTTAEVEAIIAQAERDLGATWRALGDEEDNIGTVEQSSDPALAIIERVTNSIDAMLDLKALITGGRMPRTPRGAARQWFAIPEEGLGTMDDPTRRSLAETSLRVHLSDSGVDRRPTVAIRDFGCGQHPSEFSNTLLSIHRGNKRERFYLMGQYGQGGATTYRFSHYTIVMSRRHPEILTEGLADLVGWSVVRYNELDPNMFKTGRYEYLVMPDGAVPQFRPNQASPDFPAGTQIVHVTYDLHGYAEAYTQLGNSIWALFHSALFDPLLPFQIGGDRPGDLRADPNAATVGRIVIGNFARLSSPKRARGDAEIIPGTPFDINLGSAMGTATCRYWILRRPESSDSRTAPADAYVRAEAAVTMTLYGQRQDNMTRSWLKENTRLPYLSRNLIVQIEADELTAQAKRTLFASTREAAIRSELRDQIYASVASELAKNELLRSLEEEEKERALARGTRKVSERVRQRLAKLIKKRIPGAFKEVPIENGNGSDRRKRRKKTRKPIPTPLPDDSYLPSVPTRLEIKTKPVRIEQGGTASLRLLLDAKNGYLPEHNADLTIRFSADGFHVQSRSHLRGGEANWTIRADSDAAIGPHDLRVRLTVPGGRVLRDSTTVEVRQRRARGGTKREPETGPEVIWLDRDGWPDDWDELTVGDVNEGATVEIRLNRDFASLARELRKPGLGPSQIETRLERYLYPVACSLYYQEYFAKQIAEAERPSEEYQRNERIRIAEAVLMAISPDVEVAGQTET